MYVAVSCDGAIVRRRVRRRPVLFDVPRGARSPWTSRRGAGNPQGVASHRAGRVRLRVAGRFGAVVHYSGAVFVTLLHHTPVVGVAFDPPTRACWPPPRRAAGWACTSPNAGSCPSAGGARRSPRRRRGSPPRHSAKVYGATFFRCARAPAVRLGRRHRARGPCARRARVCGAGSPWCSAFWTRCAHTPMAPELRGVCFTGSWGPAPSASGTSSRARACGSRATPGGRHDIGTHRDRLFAVTCRATPPCASSTSGWCPRRSCAR